MRGEGIERVVKGGVAAMVNLLFCFVVLFVVVFVLWFCVGRVVDWY